MPTDRVLDLIDQIDYARFVLPQFWGEPTLHPQFEEILSHCKGRGKHVSFYTNGSLFHKKDLDVILSNTDLIHISIQSSGRDHFMSIARVDAFEQVRANIINLWRVNESLGAPCRLVIRASDVFRDEVDTSAYKEFWGPFCHAIKIRPIRDLALGIRHFAPIPNFHCSLLDEHCIIKCNGDMVLCCSDRHGEYNVGNVFERDVEDVFNSEAMTSARSRAGSLPCCLNCWYRYKGSETLAIGEESPFS